LPYPALRWEFFDLDQNGTPADVDANGGDDLGPTWSLPVTGRVRVDEGGAAPVDRFVAVFGGGLDPENDAVGNFIYMVDVETGKILYKRATGAAVPSQPAAVDSDRNGYLDLIYVGDVDGHLYKINMGEVPTLVPDATTGELVVSEDDWKPLEIFDTEGRSIFFSPTVIWSAKRRSYAIAVGTGDREDLWSVTNGEPDGMFVFMDRGFTEDNLPEPYTQAALMNFKRDDAATPISDVLLQSPPLTELPGYAIEFANGERLISKVFAISGLMVFSTFEPASAAIGGICSSNGISNLYTLQTSTGNPLVSGKDRYRTVEGFVSDPFASPSVDSSGSDDGGETDNTPPEDLKAVTDLLKSQMPENCKFTNKRIDVKAIRSDTGVEWLAPIPVCVQQKNWKQWQTR
jgi:Tfp pilus tip-associated adhesin PilY1